MIEETTSYHTRQLVAIRKKLHQYPEVSGKEEKTAQTIVQVLENFQPNWIKEGLGGFGVLASIGDASKALRVLFRAELDALPIKEINQFEHKSNYEGVSHKCGHDGHMAILLGLADQLNQYHTNAGEFLFLFQPAEETGEGAKAVLKENVIQSTPPDYCFSLHNLPAYPKGSVILRKGAFSAAVKSLIIRLNGKTSHAAEPENGINPALAIAEIIQYSQSLIKDNPNQEDFTLITPIHIRMGEKAYGVSAGAGEVHFTIRCWEQPIMDKLTQELIKHINTIATKYQLTIQTEWTNEFMTNFNNDLAVEIVEEAARSLKLEVIYRDYPIKWGEDFGAITQNYKGCMFGLGAGINHPALHNPDYDFPDELIDIGVALFKKITDLVINIH